MLEKVTTPIYNFCHEIKVKVIHALALLAEHLRGIASKVHQIAMRLFPFGTHQFAPSTDNAESLKGRASKISTDTEAKPAEPEPSQPDPVEPPKDETLPPVIDQTRAIVVYSPIKTININLPKTNLFKEVDLLQKLFHHPFPVAIPRIPLTLPEENRERAIVVYVPPAAPQEPVAIIPAVEAPIVEPGILSRAGGAVSRFFSRGKEAMNAVVDGGKSVAEKTTKVVQKTANAVIEKGQDAAQMAGNAAGYVVGLGLAAGAGAVKGAAKVINGKQQLESGLDLYPYFTQAATAGVKAAQAGNVAFNDYMNQPSADLDPVTANILKGFADEIGTDLHNLLINALNLKGHIVVQKLAEKLNIIEMAGKKVAEGYLHLGNPVGLVMFFSKMLLTVTNLGIDLRGLTRGGAIAAVNDQIDAFFIDQLLNDNNAALTREDILYYLKLEPVSVAKENYERLALKPEMAELAEAAKAEWQQLEAQFKALGLSKPKPAAAAPRPASWARDLLDFFYDDPKELACQPAVIAATTLKNTLKKTIAHFLETMPDNQKGILTELLVGSELSLAEKALKPVGLTGKATALALAFYGNPINAWASHIPKPVKKVWNDALAPANRRVGAMAADLFINESYIDDLGLTNLQVVDERLLNLNILSRVRESKMLNEEVLETLNYAFRRRLGLGTSFDARIQQLLQDAGRSMARIVARGMATQAAKMIGGGHTPDELIGGKINLSIRRKVVRMAGTGLRVGVVHVIQSAVYTTKEYGNTAQQMINHL